jgi:hypothetical protein
LRNILKEGESTLSGLNRLICSGLQPNIFPQLHRTSTRFHYLNFSGLQRSFIYSISPGFSPVQNALPLNLWL